MESVKNAAVTVKQITPEDGHYFYGYYDNPAWSGDDRYHLCHKVRFWERLPEKDDVAEIGMIDIDNGSFIKLGKTTAWNFQQGSMLQWHPLHPNEEIIYNIYLDGAYRGLISNIRTGDMRYLERPVTNVDPTGKHALSVSFERMFDFRPGYGYAGAADPYLDRNHPDEDGIFLIDLATGASRLIISLQQLWAFTGSAFAGKDQKILINHINFNTDGTRFLCLVRNFWKQGSHWKTAILTANTDGSDMFLLSDYAMASHYHWKDTENIVIWSSGAKGSNMGNQLYLLKDRSNEVRLIDREYFLKDGHCSYSPDRSIMLYDSYPDTDSYRHLYLYHLAQKRGVTLGSFYSQPHISGDIRCDLHPRWNRAGTAISFDSTHEGQRRIYTMDVERIF